MSRFLVHAGFEPGHVYPIVPTLLELARRGHDVAVRAGTAQVEALQALGLRAQALDPAIEAIAHDDWRARTPVGALRRDVRGFAERAPLEARDLERALAQERADAVLVEFLAWGAALVAERSGLPWASFAHAPLPLPSRDVPPFGPGLRPRGDRVGRVRDAVVHQLAFRPLERIVSKRLNVLRRAHGLPKVRTAADVLAAAPLLLAYTAEPFEYPRSDWPPSVRLVGPGLWDPPSEPPAWLDAVDRPLVLVTCSTLFQNDGRLVEVALEALRDEPYHVVATTGDVDPAQFSPPANARVERFLPHSQLLTRAACVVCHAGMGITQKALAAGVPVCAVPFGRDQLEVARRLEVARAGTRLPAARLAPGRLRAAVREAIACRAGAERIAAGFAAAGGPAAAADELEALAGAARPVALAG